MNYLMLVVAIYASFIFISNIYIYLKILKGYENEERGIIEIELIKQKFYIKTFAIPFLFAVVGWSLFFYI